MQVLVTGAAGFLGRAFARSHIERGDDVYGVDDLSNSHSFWPAELKEDRRAQADAGQWLAAAPESRLGWDLVYHFAAPVGGRVKIEGDPLFNADSLRLDAQLFRWASRAVVGTVVYPSSSAVYGVRFQSESAIDLAERLFSPSDSVWHPPDEMYGFTKLVGEFLAWKAASYGVNTLCLRPFSGYGEEQSLEYPVPSIARRAAKREDPLVIWGSGDQTRDFIHIIDVVGATAARLAAGVEGHAAMNIGSGAATTFRSIAEVLARLEGYTPVIVADDTKPQGVLNRWSDNSEMLRYYRPTVDLETGLAAVLRYQKARLDRERPEDGISPGVAQR